MKRNISISYRTICAGIFVIISIIILAINGISLFKYDNATDYEKSVLRPGEYVKFQLKDYLSKPLDEYNSDEIFSPQYQAVLFAPEAKTRQWLYKKEVQNETVKKYYLEYMEYNSAQIENVAEFLSE